MKSCVPLTSRKCFRMSLTMISWVSYGCTLVNAYMLIIASSNRIRGNPRVPLRACDDKEEYPYEEKKSKQDVLSSREMQIFKNWR